MTFNVMTVNELSHEDRDLPFEMVLNYDTK